MTKNSENEVGIDHYNAMHKLSASKRFHLWAALGTGLFVILWTTPIEDDCLGLLMELASAVFFWFALKSWKEWERVDR